MVGAGQQAGGGLGFHHHQPWCRAVGRAHLGRHRRRHAADAALHEDMAGRRPGPLVHRFIGHHPVALHDVARHLGIAVPRGVGDHEPAIGLRDGGSFAHGIIVSAGDHADLRAVMGDGVDAALADAFMHENHAGGAEALRAPGDRAAVIAVGGTGEGDAGGGGAETPGDEVGGAGIGGDAAPGQFIGQHHPNRIGPAQRLETAEPEAAGFIFDAQSGDADFRSQRRQIPQRGDGIAGPGGDFGFGAAEPAFGQHHGAGGAELRIGEQAERVRCDHTGSMKPDRLSVTPTPCPVGRKRALRGRRAGAAR